LWENKTGRRRETVDKVYVLRLPNVLDNIYPIVFLSLKIKLNKSQESFYVIDKLIEF
jgi:hypothetical protein